MLLALKKMFVAVVVGGVLDGNGCPHAAEGEKDGDERQDLGDEFRNRRSVLQDGEECCYTSISKAILLEWKRCKMQERNTTYQAQRASDTP